MTTQGTHGTTPVRPAPVSGDAEVGKRRIAVVSSHSQTALALHLFGFETVEHPVGREPLPQHLDALLLEPGRAADADRLLAFHRSRSPSLPMVLLLSDPQRPLEHLDDKVAVVVTPATVRDIANALERVLSGTIAKKSTPAVPAITCDSEPEQTRGADIPSQPLLETSLTTADVGLTKAPVVPEQAPARAGARRLQLPMLQKKPTRRHTPSKARIPPAQRLSEVVTDIVKDTTPPQHILQELARSLATSSGADVAVLRRQAEVWTVAAGHGLRSVETRPLADLPGPVEALDDRAAALSMDETDTMRGSFVGFPLTRHRNLLVLRRPADIVTALGRSEPFSKDEVVRALTALRDVTSSLRESMDIEESLLALIGWYED